MRRMPRLSSLHLTRRCLAATICLTLAFVLTLAIPVQRSSAAGPACFGKPATIVGTGAANKLKGTTGADVIVGGGGRDKIRGRGGADRICGGAEEDKIFGGTGADKLDGGASADTLFGEGGEDFARGDQGADRLFGEQRDDNLDGGGGPDEIFGGGGADFILGGPNPAAPDNLFGGPGNNTLGGEGGDDNLFGGPDNDNLDGGTDEGDSDNCQQAGGTGTVVNCEADLAVDVSGPSTAPVGEVVYSVTVTNNGPSTIGYGLEASSDNSNLACPTDTLPAGRLAEEPLAPGASRTRVFSVTCSDEDAPGGEVSVRAAVSGPKDPTPGTPGNESDTQVTTVS